MDKLGPGRSSPGSISRGSATGCSPLRDSSFPSMCVRSTQSTLATAAQLGPELGRVVTYDERMVEAAQQVG